MSEKYADDADWATAAEQSSEDDEAQEGNILAEEERSSAPAEHLAIHVVDDEADADDADLDDIEIDDPDECGPFDAYCQEYAELRAKENLTPQQIRDLLHDPVYFSCMLHRHGVIDGICSGVHYSTAELARPAIKMLHGDPG